MTGKYLRRYTDLPALIYLLKERRVTLLDPESWDDGNDSHYMSQYREKRRLKTLLALCFTRADETYHHWRVFAPGPGGVSIKFIRSKVIKSVTQYLGMRAEEVTYLKLAELRGQRLRTRDLPFLKRYAFEHENEFRVVYESKSERRSTLDIDVPLAAINTITLSPWLHPSLADHVKAVIKQIPGCSELRIVRSTLIGNDEWKSLGEDSE